MSTKQTSLESFLRKKKRLSEETEMSSTSKKRVTFNRQYHESYLKYGFVETGDSHKPKPLCIVLRRQFSNEA
ncbi:SCAN domain-containing protein 3, partial [Trichonephila inaurata madagascariensis]